MNTESPDPSVWSWNLIWSDTHRIINMVCCLFVNTSSSFGHHSFINPKIHYMHFYNLMCLCLGPTNTKTFLIWCKLWLPYRRTDTRWSCNSLSAAFITANMALLLCFTCFVISLTRMNKRHIYTHFPPNPWLVFAEHSRLHVCFWFYFILFDFTGACKTRFDTPSC